MTEVKNNELRFTPNIETYIQSQVFQYTAKTYLWTDKGVLQCILHRYGKTCNAQWRYKSKPSQEFPIEKICNSINTLYRIVFDHKLYRVSSFFC